LTTDDLRSLGVRHVEQYFGIWAILEDVFRAAVSRVERLDLRAHVLEGLAADSAGAVTAASRSEPRYALTREGVAIIPVRGTLTKYDSSFAETSTVRLRQAVRAARRADDVDAILLVIDSPGGTVAGIRDLAADIQSAAAEKPLDAYIEDTGASAAYWLASQARQVWANPTALVGSIGTFMVLDDMSGRAEQLGIKVHVIRAGAFKGMGTPGTEITEAHLGESQRLVDAVNAHFLDAVASGRGLLRGRVAELADGRVHVGAAAVDLGLIDGIRSFDEVLGGLVDAAHASGARAAIQQERTAAMAKEKDGSVTEVVEAATTAAPAAPSASGPGAATYHDIAAACVGADAEFLVSQLAAEATVSQAQHAWMVEQQNRLAAKDKALSAARSQSAGSGVDALDEGAAAGTSDAESGDAVERFSAAVKEKMGSGLSRSAAIVSVARSQRDLHKAFLLATNPGKQAQRLVEEWYE